MSEPSEHVTKLFEHYTLALIDKGLTKYSSRAILHRIRWHMNVERSDAQFKCNNNWTPKMVRDFLKKYPEHDGFFETRKARIDAYATEHDM